MDELILKIAKEMDLPAHEVEMLKSDINNLRGYEWLEDILENCSVSTYRKFRKLINSL